MTEAPEWKNAPTLRKLTSEDVFSTGATLGDFWAWAFNDLRLNTTRGILAEFLVATALGIDINEPRKEWENFDLLWDGIKIEVKSTATWQSWKQRGPSSPKFGGLTARRFVEETNSYTVEREVWADVYVFAHHHCDEPEDYDPLDVSQWSFWVAPRSLIETNAARSVGLSWVKSDWRGPLEWAELSEIVKQEHTRARQGRWTDAAGVVVVQRHRRLMEDNPLEYGGDLPHR